uniref:Uncharacterized protein n=1 Tax=Lepeophtheirus salmonis TaxID=72036 RepID=A0A0K2T9Z0_LEPSM
MNIYILYLYIRVSSFWDIVFYPYNDIFFWWGGTSITLSAKLPCAIFGMMHRAIKNTTSWNAKKRNQKLAL